MIYGSFFRQILILMYSWIWAAIYCQNCKIIHNSKNRFALTVWGKAYSCLIHFNILISTYIIFVSIGIVNIPWCLSITMYPDHGASNFILPFTNVYLWHLCLHVTNTKHVIKHSPVMSKKYAVVKLRSIDNH